MSGTDTRRPVIVHYHLFKNAGTSVERLLKEAFGKGWQSHDRDEPGARISAAEMQAWLEAHPRIRAVSSHQLVPPLPEGDFRAVPIVFLRDPIVRVRSAYLFEWQKQLGLSEPKGSLAAYVDEKFEQRNTSVIANFQVARLSNTGYDEVNRKLHRYDENLLPKACRFVASLPSVGIVERYAESLELLQCMVAPHFPNLVMREFHENVTQGAGEQHEARLETLRREIGNDRYDELCARNRLDLQLYGYALGRFEMMVGSSCRDAA